LLLKAWPEPTVTRVPSLYYYDIAISYASEDRAVAETLANRLTARGVNVFYDRSADIQASLWGKDLYAYFAELYSKRARYCLVVISSNYVRKAWTRHELQAAQERALKESLGNREYILPLRLDNTEVPGIFPTVKYVDWQEFSADTIVDFLLIKLQS
jgi:hypothetical protein